jgi:hypothetical protein
MPNPSHPAWQKICPFTQMTHATCNKGDVPEGMSGAHISWHAQRMVEIGEMIIVPGVGADDPDHVAYQLKENGEE